MDGLDTLIDVDLTTPEAIELDELKKLGGPRLTEAKEGQNDKLDTLITLTGVACDLLEENLNVNQDILEEKKNNHSAWIKATNRRFYISLAAVMVTGAVLYLDVLKLNVDSEIINSAIGFIDAMTGLLL